MYLMVRADARAALPEVMAALRSRLPPPPADAWTEPRLTRDAISGSESLRQRRFMLILLGTFAGLAVLLAAVGLYGIVSGSIAERRREIGVRVALGATPRAIVWQVQAETLRLCLGELPDRRRRGLRPQPLHRLPPLRYLCRGRTNVSRRRPVPRRHHARGELPAGATRGADRPARGAARIVTDRRASRPQRSACLIAASASGPITA